MTAQILQISHYFIALSCFLKGHGTSSRRSPSGFYCCFRKVGGQFHCQHVFHFSFGTHKLFTQSSIVCSSLSSINCFTETACGFDIDFKLKLLSFPQPLPFVSCTFEMQETNAQPLPCELDAEMQLGETTGELKRAADKSGGSNIQCVYSHLLHDV